MHIRLFYFSTSLYILNFQPVTRARRSYTHLKPGFLDTEQFLWNFSNVTSITTERAFIWDITRATQMIICALWYLIFAWKINLKYLKLTPYWRSFVIFVIVLPEDRWAPSWLMSARFSTIGYPSLRSVVVTPRCPTTRNPLPMPIGTIWKKDNETNYQITYDEETFQIKST